MKDSKAQLARWAFTLSYNKTPDRKILHAWLTQHCRMFVYQLEVGDTGYKHWQGRFALSKKRRKSEITFKLLSDDLKTMELSPEVTLNDTDFYVTKTDTRESGPWSNKDEEELELTEDVLHLHNNLFRWQENVIHIAKTKDWRAIHFIWDEMGNIGKSTLLKYMRCKKVARILPPMTNQEDIMAAVCDMPTSRCYVIDMPRSMPKEKLYHMYAGIETIKGGYAYDKRNHFKEKVFTSPNIIVFANMMPKFAYLSNDRWVIWTIMPDGHMRNITPDVLNKTDDEIKDFKSILAEEAKQMTEYIKHKKVPCSDLYISTENEKSPVFNMGKLLQPLEGVSDEKTSLDQNDPQRSNSLDQTNCSQTNASTPVTETLEAEKTS